MRRTWQRGAVLLAAGVLAVAVLLGLSHLHPASGAAAERASGTARYSVVETQGHNLLVTDNDSNTLYFYTVDKEKPVGSPLKLRAAIDLTQVGQPQIRVQLHNVQR